MIADRLKDIRKQIPSEVKLLAVSKTKPIEAVQEAYQAGQFVFAENKAQELRDKHAALAKDIEWHFIGHLQSNKVKYIAPFVHLIHSIDRLDLLAVVDKEGQKNERIIDCLLEFHIAREDSKFGLTMEKAEALLKSEEYKQMKNIRICGVMGMASYTEDKEQIRREFALLQSIFANLKHHFFAENSSFREISMGMSGDYLLAIEEGSTMLRIGSAIFGGR